MTIFYTGTHKPVAYPRRYTFPESRWLTRRFVDNLLTVCTCPLYKCSILHTLRSSSSCCWSSTRRWVSFGWRLLNCRRTSCIRSLTEIFSYCLRTASIRSISLWRARNSSSLCRNTSGSKSGMFAFVLFALFVFSILIVKNYENN